MKFLLLIALFLIVLWVLRKSRASGQNTRPPTAKAPERMVKCAYCGVNQPVSESILTNGRYYCCNEHRHEAESGED